MIVGIGTPMIGKFYLYHALTLTTKMVETGRNSDCPLCGKAPSIAGVGEKDESRRVR